MKQDSFKKTGIFLLAFFYGLSITFYYLVPSYNLDGYCQLSLGFKNYAQYFFSSGRFVTGWLWCLFDLIRIPHNLLSIISILLANIFLSLSVLEVYKSFLKYANSRLKKVILLLSSLLIIYNPYVMEIFIYEESFVMALSIFSVMKASKLCFDKKYLWGGLVLLLANMMYQGSICLFIPYYFLLLLFENKDKKLKEFIKINYKRIIITGIIYGLSMVIVYVSMKLYIDVFNVNSVRNGNVNILENIKIIFHHILGDIGTRQCMMRARYFNMALCLIAAFVIISLIIEKKYTQMLYVLLLVLSIVMFAFVPNLAMPSKSNYIFARMIISCGAMIGFVSLCSLLVDRKLGIVLVFISLFFAFNTYNYLVSARRDHIRYENDMEKLELIRSSIEKYESESNNKVTEVKYMVNSSNKIYFYFNNKYSVFGQKILHNDWGFICGVQGIIDNELYVTHMSKEEYKTYLKDASHDAFDESDMVFEGNTLYILIF